MFAAYAVMCTILSMAIPIRESWPEPLLKIFRKTGFARSAERARMLLKPSIECGVTFEILAADLPREISRELPGEDTWR